MGSVVYVVGPVDGAFKIGRTRNLAQRLDQLAALPVRIAVHAAIGTDNASWLEAYLHTAFAHCLAGREWFRLTDDDIELLKAIPVASCEADLPGTVATMHREEVERRRQRKPKLTTVAVSVEFARMLKDLARASDATIAEYCDDRIAPDLVPDHIAVIEAKLESLRAKQEAA
jgi:hypothetical protein